MCRKLWLCWLVAFIFAPAGAIMMYCGHHKKSFYTLVGLMILSAAFGFVAMASA